MSMVAQDLCVKVIISECFLTAAMERTNEIGRAYISARVLSMDIRASAIEEIVKNDSDIISGYFRGKCSNVSKTVKFKPRPNDRNMPTRNIATLLGTTCMSRAFGHHVTICFDVLSVVGSSSKMVINLSQQHRTRPNMLQQGGQTHAACCAQQCYDMLCCHVAFVWTGL